MALDRWFGKKVSLLEDQKNTPADNSSSKHTQLINEPLTDILKEQKEPDILTCALKMAPYFKGLLGDEIGFYITDLTTNLYGIHGTLKLTVNDGDPIKEGSTAYKTIHSGNRTVAKVGEEVYGLPFIGTCYPLTEPSTGKIVGTILMTRPIEQQERLNKEAQQMEKRVDILAQATNNLSATAEELAATTESINNHARGIGQEINKTDDVVAFIRKIAEQTHLLGLNAAIEAARVGEAGAGFNVVASEIRKLSQDTQHSVKEIMQTLQGMQKSILELTHSIEQLSAGTQEQAATAQEINAIVSELGTVAEELKRQANNLIS